jgi:hypothetical protein
MLTVSGKAAMQRPKLHWKRCRLKSMPDADSRCAAVWNMRVAGYQQTAVSAQGGEIVQ